MPLALPRPRTLFETAIVLALAVVASCIATGAAGAQVVRGSVVERTTDAPLVGVIVELFPAGGDAVRVASALTDASGSFALRAPTAGRYIVAAKRIGVRRYTSPPIDVGAGETKPIRIVLEALDFQLPEVVVTANNPLCTTDPADQSRVASMWEEVHSALDAAQISLRDRLFSADVTRYARELDPKTKRVVNESRSETRAVVASPILTAPAESLSAFGYWSDDAKGATIYRGPDAEVLLSDSFLRDHCFHVVKGEKGRSGMTGLAFTPVAGRPVPDIVGNFWLDAKSFELRLVEFKYDRVKPGVDSAALGGEVHFARLANGAWTVRRWFLRLPANGRPTQPLSTEGSSPWVLVRPTTFRLSEEGGLVTTDEQRAPVRPATLEGVVRDSSGKRPLAQVTLRLTGTTRTTTSDDAGKFSFAQLPPGSYTLRAELAFYDSLGVAAAELPVSLGDGETKRVELKGRDVRDVTMRLCKGEAPPFGRGTLLVVVRDATSRAPVAGATASVSWMSTLGRAAGDSARVSAEGVTSDAGVAALCAIPADASYEVMVKRGAASAKSGAIQVRARDIRKVSVDLPQ